MTATQTKRLDTQTYYTNALEATKQELPEVNQFALPQIEKIVINAGVGKMDTKQRQEVGAYLEKLTGQKTKMVQTGKSIAGFKTRKGDLNAAMVTLRGKKMLDFLLLLVYIALPRTKDFRGIKRDAFDKQGRTYNLGIPNASIFPQIGFDSSVQFGLQISIVFKQAGESNKILLEKLNFPFSRQ
jgi:large subunit ribosomal protein L5